VFLGNNPLYVLVNSFFFFSFFAGLLAAGSLGKFLSSDEIFGLSIAGEIERAGTGRLDSDGKSCDVNLGAVDCCQVGATAAGALIELLLDLLSLPIIGGKSLKWFIVLVESVVKPGGGETG